MSWSRNGPLLNHDLTGPRIGNTGTHSVPRGARDVSNRGVSHVLGSELGIECPLHGAQFDVRDGQALEPPAEAPVETYVVRLEGETILIRRNET